MCLENFPCSSLTYHRGSFTCTGGVSHCTWGSTFGILIFVTVERIPIPLILVVYFCITYFWYLCICILPYLTDKVSSTSSHPFGSMLKMRWEFLRSRLLATSSTSISHGRSLLLLGNSFICNDKPLANYVCTSVLKKKNENKVIRRGLLDLVSIHTSLQDSFQKMFSSEKIS